MRSLAIASTVALAFALGLALVACPRPQEPPNDPGPAEEGGDSETGDKPGDKPAEKPVV